MNAAQLRDGASLPMEARDILLELPIGAEGGRMDEFDRDEMPELGVACGEHLPHPPLSKGAFEDEVADDVTFGARPRA
jgi:hypothetical protein